jgi:hypothetical protein
VRSLISSILLLLFLWQIGGYLLEFQLESTRIRKEIKKLTKEAVPRNQLVYFQFSDKEIQNLTWTKKNEFKKDVHFYDVVWKKNLANGVVEFQCVSDDQETVLFAKLDQYVSANLANSNPDKPLKNWSKLVFGVYLPSQFDIQPIFKSSLSAYTENGFYYKDQLSIGFLFIETPPPNGEFA